MRCLKLKDGPEEDTEGEQRGAGAAAAGLGGALSEKERWSYEKDKEGVNMGRYKWTLLIWYSGLVLNY